MKKPYYKTILITIVYVLSVVIFNSCAPYPSEQDYITDYDIVYTKYEESKDFGQYTTYSLPDKIPFLDNSSDDPTYLDDTNASLANLIKTKLNSMMSSRGYTLVDSDSDPDLLLNIGVLNTKVSDHIDDCWWYDDSFYWNWYPGWDWDWDWGWGYYPCWGSYYSYNKGSLVIDLVDTKGSTVSNCDQPDSNCLLDTPWNCIINGLLSDTTIGLDNRIQNSIDQAFKQSPYLKK
ncbi:DUF4136 domain-containing protein [Tenacibaculum sp. UWU-22]|uniref:DUF4136 domain-containing protein n=1 Tax=Tenacibaculum sp. UWU-22 TaxID=3234187 RepID=UPI0034DB2005